MSPSIPTSGAAPAPSPGPVTPAAPTAAPAREAPAPDPVPSLSKDPAHESLAPDTKKGMPGEPVLHIDEIQGNILAGFTKDYQALLFLQIDDPALFQRWLASQIPFIATTAEVLAFNRLFKAIRSRRKVESNTVKATWVNIAFTAQGLTKLKAVAPEVDPQNFGDEAFVAGLASQSPGLGDPTDPSADGHPDNWFVGGTKNESDVVMIVASDDREDMLAAIERLVSSLSTTAGPGAARLLYLQEGANLPPPLSGHEHFGYLDGVSQPGVRGRLSDLPGDVFMLRQNPNKRDNAASGGDVAQGKPGQDMLWPGQFVFGYPGQDGDPKNGDIDTPTKGNIGAGKGRADLPWANDGSFLVIRRLRQDVAGFHQFLHEQAPANNFPAPAHASAPRFLGARLIGRWHSGAPVRRAPDDENPSIAADDCINNNFEYQDGTAPIPAPGMATSPFDCRDPVGVSGDDKQGAVCPFTAHIRKVYPRDDVSIDPKDDKPDVDGCTSRTRLTEVDTQAHRILRRGIPYGPISPSTPDAPQPDGADRGLLFLSYQTSIVDQFEFIQACWANNPDFKEIGAGYDPIIGQNNAAGQERKRFFVTSDAQGKPIRLETKADWVIPTGGGYFFTPSISGLEKIAKVQAGS